ncbi:hypothetical protein THIX_90263 [Thiomonas sp. X19]|nr:hypothetical protein THIX_90263 [Thiomonas sp. X19]
MNARILISPADLAAAMKTGPMVIIDTRDPEAYAKGHLPGAVNLRDILTHLAISTPQGRQELQQRFADEFGAAGLSGAETAVLCGEFDEQRLRPVLPRLFPAHRPRLPQGEGAAWRLCGMGRSGHAGEPGRPHAQGGDLPAEGQRGRGDDRQTPDAGRARRPLHRHSRRARCRRVGRHQFLTLWPGLLPAQGPHSRCALAGAVPHDEAHAAGPDVQGAGGNSGRMRHGGHRAAVHRPPRLLQGRARLQHRPGAAAGGSEEGEEVLRLVERMVARSVPADRDRHARNGRCRVKLAESAGACFSPAPIPFHHPCICRP